MAMKYTNGYGPDDLMKTLYAKKVILDGRMEHIAKEGAEDIKNLSVAYSPVDTGEVEAAHKVIERTTRAGNVALDVEVGGIIDGVDTDEYVQELHEGVMRGHPYNLGKLSIAKAESTGEPVGPKFLERAFLKLKPRIVKDFQTLNKEFCR